MEENFFTIIDENGNESLCEIILTFHSDEFENDYVIYTIPGQDDENEQEVSAARYVQTDETDGELMEIETDEEWELVEQVLAEFEAEADLDA
jgi:Uncharacterized protein conserved in bacteria